MEPVVKLSIDVVGADAEACRKLLRSLCDLIDSDFEGSPSYDVSKAYGSASCKVLQLEPEAAICGT